MSDSQVSKLRDTINKVTVHKFSPHLSKIYFTHLHELPDRCRDFPEQAQRDFLVTFNNNLARWGNYDDAFKAATKAMHRRADQIKAEAAKRKRGSRMDDIDFGRLLPRRPQIVIDGFHDGHAQTRGKDVTEQAA